MANPVIIGNCTLYLGDCREILPTLGTVDAVVTSPPYDQQREYGGIGDWSLLVPVAMPLVPWHDKTQFLVNLGLIYRDGECIEYWQDLIAEMRNHGFRLFGWYVWDQGDGLPGDWNGRFAPCHEFVFHFNRMARRPNKTFPTKSKGRIITGTGLRKKDGTTNDRMSHDGATVQSTKIPDSVIRIYREMTRDVDHPAIFPTALPHFLAEAFSDAGETILDPFMGSGTTGVACVKLGRKFIGIEIHEPYFDIACKRIQAAVNEPRLPMLDQPHFKQEAML